MQYTSWRRFETKRALPRLCCKPRKSICELPPKLRRALNCLRHLNRLEVPWPADECITVPMLLANRAMEALKLPGRFMPTADGAVLDMCEHSLLAPPSSPRSCMVEHMDLTSTPMLPGNATSRADSPVSPGTLALRAEWPVSQDSPVLPGNATYPTESPVSPANAALRTDSPMSHENAALRADSPMSHENAAWRGDSPMSPGNAAYPTDAAVSPGRTTNRNVASSMSKKARRRAAFKARKQQQVLRRW